jgi:RHS repeat-associated protein
VESDAYFNLTGLVYSTDVTLGTGGQVQPNGTVTGNYWPTIYAYDHRGRQNRIVSPTGTLSRTVYDGLGRVISTWTGTNDSGATDQDPSGGGDPNNNMTQLSLNVYDGSGDVGGVGNSNLTQVTQFPNDGTPDRVTQNYYDWRNRLVATKAGVQSSEDTTTHRPIIYTEYNNLSQPIAQEQYDGDGITVSIGSDGVPVRPPANLLRARSTTEFDDQGRVFRTHTFSVDQGNGTISPTSLTTNVWYDHRGNVIKTSAPGGLVTKTQHDGAGRPNKSFTTDGAGDVTWADARTILPTNTVLTQIETQYDSNGNSIFVISKQRFHDVTTTGELDPTTSRISFEASYYDLANRLTATVNVGTNGGTAYTRPPTVPPRSDTVLVTSQTYNAAGWVENATDALGLITRTLYDNLGRSTTNIEDYTDGVPTNSTNRTTQFTYDGSGHVVTQTALLPMGMVQTTQSIYGVTSAGGSNLSSNDLVALIKYPDKTTGLPSDNPADQESFTYNALGQQNAKTDRNGTVHTYSYDVLGRLTADAVTVLGLGVDGHVQALQTAYDTGGRPYLYTSFDAPSGGNIINQVQQVYNGLGQLTAEYQFHGDPAVTTPGVVQYTFSEMAGGANHSRLVSMTYPNGRVLHYGYNPGLDDSISRLSFLADDDGSGGSGTHLEEYSYLGLNTVVKRAHPESGVDLTYIKLNTEPNGDAGDQYTGLDRFGRVVDQRWLPPANPQSATDRFQYSYDRDGNRLTRTNLVNPAFSEQNSYDALNRLTSFAQGSHTQGWNLDSLGNWNTVTTDGTSQNRSHDQQNQITSISPPSTAPVYDNNGNTTTDDAGQTYVYDAWNRQVQVQDSSGNSLANYTYDALGRRVQEIENDFFGNPVTRDLFFSTQWQVVEEWETDSSANTVVRAQNVWSPVYVDAMILRDRDPAAGGSGSLSERFYVQQDANWNVTGLVDTTGTVGERYVYDPYGRATVVDPNTWMAIGASQFNWVYLHQGGRYDNATGLYQFRHRDYSPTLGRWMQQDPLGYVNGLNLYADEGDNPPNERDPAGTQVFIRTPPGTRWTPGRLGMTCSFVTGRCVPTRRGAPLSRCTELIQIATGRVLFCWTVRIGNPIFLGPPFPSLTYP